MKIPLQKLIVQLHVGSLAMPFVKIYHRIRKGPKSSELSLTRQDKKRHDKTRQDKTRILQSGLTTPALATSTDTTISLCPR